MSLSEDINQLMIIPYLLCASGDALGLVTLTLVLAVTLGLMH